LEQQERALADTGVGTFEATLPSRSVIAIYYHRGPRTSWHAGRRLGQLVGVLVLIGLLASATEGSGTMIVVTLVTRDSTIVSGTVTSPSLVASAITSAS
jgi:hypothetical protein